MNNRVVVTGVGAVTSVGIGKEEFWKNIIAGKSGISDVTLFDTSKFTRHKAGEIKNFTPIDFIPANKTKFLRRASQFAVAATKLALKDAAVPVKYLRSIESAFLIGTTMIEARLYDFSSKRVFREEWGELNSSVLLNTFAPSIALNAAMFFKAEGINLMIPTACAAGNYAISYGFDLIKRGEVDFVIAGGVDSLSRIAFQGFQRLYAMAPDVCSPFDKNRKGMILGEGAGILVLESLAHATKRKALVIAEVLGCGLSCDAHHVTAPNRKGIKKAIEKALANSGIAANDVDYISAHGTGTAHNDKEEAGAIKEVFGSKTPVSSIKSMLGHCMGAASAVEAITCCLAIRDGIMPPTINFSTLDPECDIDCIPNKARKVPVKIALNNAFAFGGNNCCVAFKEFS